MHQKSDFVIFPVSRGYIVYNKRKSFAQGHSHIKSLPSAQAAVDFVCKGKIPRRAGNYYLRSLMRLATDVQYIEDIQKKLSNSEVGDSLES